MTIKIPQERLKELQRIEMKMKALEAAGVDNWEFYGEALNEYKKQIEKEIEITIFFEDLIEIISEGIEGPAWSGCGYGINKETLEQAFTFFTEKIAKLKK